MFGLNREFIRNQRHAISVANLPWKFIPDLTSFQIGAILDNNNAKILEGETDGCLAALEFSTFYSFLLDTVEKLHAIIEEYAIQNKWLDPYLQKPSRVDKDTDYSEDAILFLPKKKYVIGFYDFSLRKWKSGKGILCDTVEPLSWKPLPKEPVSRLINSDIGKE